MNNERAELIELRAIAQDELKARATSQSCLAWQADNVPETVIRLVDALLAADAQAGGEAVVLVDETAVRVSGSQWPMFMAPRRILPAGSVLYTHPQPQAVAQGWKLYGNRRDFERYAADQGYRDFEQNEFSDYKNSHTQARWNFWRAGQDAMLSASPAAPREAQPERVPLTRAQCEKLVRDHFDGPEGELCGADMVLIRAVEAAHHIGKPAPVGPLEDCHGVVAGKEAS